MNVQILCVLPTLAVSNSLARLLPFQFGAEKELVKLLCPADFGSRQGTHKPAFCSEMEWKLGLWLWPKMAASCQPTGSHSALEWKMGLSSEPGSPKMTLLADQEPPFAFIKPKSLPAAEVSNDVTGTA